MNLERSPFAPDRPSSIAPPAGAGRDHTAFLQGLIDSGCGRVAFPDGAFLVSTPLLVASDTTLVCSPRTSLRLVDGANCPILMNRADGRGTRNITVEEGLWDGNNVAQTRGHGENGYAGIARREASHPRRPDSEDRHADPEGGTLISG